MFSVPRIARLFLILTALLAIPSLYFFYPGPRPAALQKMGWDVGGIDGWHYRQPAEILESEQQRKQKEVDLKTPEQAAIEIEDEEQRALLDEEGVHRGSGGQRPDGDEGNEDKARMGSGGAGPATDDFDHERHRKVSGDGSEGVAQGAGGAVGGSGGGDGSEEFGKVIMPHLGNATAKAELGRGSWRLLHLMTLRYPNHPTPDDRQALKSFFHLFSRLYPCGECAEHFQEMLKEYPVQTGSRKSASLWLCNLHNIVNARLRKPEFDCLTLDETYDCGCGNETSSATGKGVEATGEAEKGKRAYTAFIEA